MRRVARSVWGDGVWAWMRKEMCGDGEEGAEDEEDGGDAEGGAGRRSCFASQEPGRRGAPALVAARWRRSPWVSQPAMRRARAGRAGRT